MKKKKTTFDDRACKRASVRPVAQWMSSGFLKP